MHPGGASVFFDEEIPGQDVTEAFYALHRHEVLQRPQYQRLQIGTIKDEESVIFGRVNGALSKVPYAEPTWLTDGYHSPYFTEFDYFHELIITQEVGRIGARGYGDGLNSGSIIGLPPVLNFARPDLRKRVADEVLSGKKFISLAISEAFAGSDVRGLKTTATKTPDENFWIINGTKKWITNGVYARSS
ncbi:hypothetical protein PHLCEN_2v11178 [Hermanssonia centrifuga]|uniref:Acyl-CoA oxidase/dehydrogenase middle domain-containing protein n=1 Tax=Hermanssonia centrifuga TaxID=98765 RepID=A0A2R6NKW2_9APHY|nr:hypothetical protein PHLCEN_2v11178 [Hermanssonia centrifuga]